MKDGNIKHQALCLKRDMSFNGSKELIRPIQTCVKGASGQGSHGVLSQTAASRGILDNFYHLPVKLNFAAGGWGGGEGEVPRGPAVARCCQAHGRCWMEGGRQPPAHTPSRETRKTNGRGRRGRRCNKAQQSPSKTDCVDNTFWETEIVKS